MTSRLLEKTMSTSIACGCRRILPAHRHTAQSSVNSSAIQDSKSRRRNREIQVYGAVCRTEKLRGFLGRKIALRLLNGPVQLIAQILPWIS